MCRIVRQFVAVGEGRGVWAVRFSRWIFIVLLCAFSNRIWTGELTGGFTCRWQALVSGIIIIIRSTICAHEIWDQLVGCHFIPPSSANLLFATVVQKRIWKLIETATH